MNEQLDNTEFDNFDPALNSAVLAVLAEPLPHDAVERVKTRARRLSIPTVSSSKPGGWRRISLGPAVHYGGIAAAVVALAAAVIFSWLTLRPAGAAFADVIQNALQAGSLRLTMTQRFGRQPESVGTMYLEENRLRIELSQNLVHVGDLEQERALFLDTKRKVAQLIEIDEKWANRFANPIDQLRRARPEDAENIGEEYLKGRLTQVFRIHRINLFGMRGTGEMLVWVDRKRGLPAKIVIHDRDPKREMEIRFEDFVWNEPLNSNLFSLDIPAGYEMGTVVLLTPRPASSTKPAPPSRIAPSRLAEGILSDDRVPGRIVWGPHATTMTAIMRDPESIGPLERKSDELRHWNVATGELKWSVIGGSSFSLAATADGKTLATVEGYELQLREPATGKVKQKWPTEKQLSPLTFSPDGKTLAAGIADWKQQPSGRGQSGGVQFWDVDQGTLKRSLSDDKPTTFVRYSRDGKHLASASNGGPVKVWDAGTGELVRIFPYGSTFDFSPDGKLIGCAASQPIEGDTPDDVRKRYDIQTYELQTGRLLKTLISDDHNKESYVLWIEFSPDGSLIAAANWDGTAKLWNVATGELVRTITDHSAGVHAAVFSPDGRIIATGSEDKMLRLWNLEHLVSQ